MIANDAKAPRIAAERLPTTGNRPGSTTEGAKVKNPQKPKIAISAPTAAISGTPYKGDYKALCAFNVSFLFRHDEIWLRGTTWARAAAMTPSDGDRERRRNRQLA
jgi:hypothetical protein